MKYGNQKEIIEKAQKASKIANTYKVTVTKNDEVIGIYFGQREAAEALGICVHTIRNTIRLGRPTSNGLSFIMERGGEINAIKDKN